MTTAAEMMKRLNPDHLQEPRTLAEVQAEVAAVQDVTAVLPVDNKKQRMRDPSGRYTFALDFTGKNGQRYTGSFTSIIPSGKVRQSIAVLRAQLGGGMPVASLDPVDRERFFVLAHLTFMLSPEKLPKWAESLEGILDTDVLYALWKEVEAHEATFFGPPESA